VTRPPHHSGESGQDRHHTKRHHAAHRLHVQNPCPHSPRQLDEATEIFTDYVEHEGRQRHNRWQLNVRWVEVSEDTDGFPLFIGDYVLEVQYSADSITWFDHSRHVVAAKDDGDDNLKVHFKIKRVHGRLAYRVRVRARGDLCKGEWSEYHDAGTAVDDPFAPSDVEIFRASHGIKLHWENPVDDVDDEIFDREIAYSVAELWVTNTRATPVAFNGTASDDKINITSHGFLNGDVLQISRNSALDPLPGGKLKSWHPYYVVNKTANAFQLAFEAGGTPIAITSNGDGLVHHGLARKARHLHKHGHLFKIHTDDFDEDQRFYGWVRNVSDHGSKSAYIPATAPEPNDDPLATPTGRRPAWHRHVFTFTIPGDVELDGDHSTGGLYLTPTRVDDDYRIRRVAASFHHPGNGDTQFDIKIDASDYVFENDTGDMTTLGSGDHDATSKAVHNSLLERGDHLRVFVDSVSADPPAHGTIHVVCDRIADGSTTDSGGGGGE